MTDTGPYYKCGGGAGGRSGGPLIAEACWAQNGAPSSPGFHPGPWIVACGPDGPNLGGVFRCASGITIVENPLGGAFSIQAEGNVTQID